MAVYVVMGVSGCGKTTIGQRLAKALNLPFYDADDYHPQENITKMASGIPLDDQDRWPWLDLLKEQIHIWETEGGAVLACSALKEQYRERFYEGDSTFVKGNFIYLKADYLEIKERLTRRKNHFFDPKLVQSQFNTLEEPSYGVVVNASKGVDEIVAKIVSQIETDNTSSVDVK